MSKQPIHEEKLARFQLEVSTLLNKLSIDNDCNTPDYLLAAYLTSALNNYAETVVMRDLPPTTKQLLE